MSHNDIDIIELDDDSPLPPRSENDQYLDEDDLDDPGDVDEEEEDGMLDGELSGLRSGENSLLPENDVDQNEGEEMAMLEDEDDILISDDDDGDGNEGDNENDSQDDVLMKSEVTSQASDLKDSDTKKSEIDSTPLDSENSNSIQQQSQLESSSQSPLNKDDVVTKLDSHVIDKEDVRNIRNIRNGVGIETIGDSQETLVNKKDKTGSVVSSLAHNKSKKSSGDSLVDVSHSGSMAALTAGVKQLDMAPDFPDTQTGFPAYMKKCVNIGKCVVINKRNWNNIEIDGHDSILDCPSQVVPLMIKKRDVFPDKIIEEVEEVEKEIEKEKTDPSATTTPNAPTSSKNMLTISDYHSSSVGKFLIGLGMSRVRQWSYKDSISKIKKQIRKEGDSEDLLEDLKDEQERLSECKKANAPYLFSMLKCVHCDFRTESKLVLERHLTFPHMTSRREFKCNYCEFATRDAKQMVIHTQALHLKKCHIEMPPQLYECPVCPYESGTKSKAATHITKCLKFFNPERLLTLSDELDYPTITPKPITQEDIKIYEATLTALRFAALNPKAQVPHIPGLPSGLQQQMYLVQQQQMGMRSVGRPNKQAQLQYQPMKRLLPQANPYGNKNMSPQLYQMLATSSGHTQLVPIQNKANSFSGATPTHQALQHQKTMKNANNNSISPNKPNILARGTNAMSSARPQQQDNVHSGGGKSGTFVICEICDGYIKDLDQLRTHMQWIHKVKIHPKMLQNRPPLNCQKCQWRFFTDSGLERHLLGAHGLVTSNMQDMVNQNQDGGRCTVCGRVFANKLVQHMNVNHKTTLKPAHLSYKCTVCSATFNLYRLFENHVYMVHSGSVKRSSDGNDSANKKNKVDHNKTNDKMKTSVNHSVVSGNKVILANN